MTTADETVIGEGVLLDTAAAGFGLRTAGALLDAVVIFALYFGSFLGLGLLVPDGLDVAALSALVLTHAIAVFIAFPVAFETLTRGRSVGKYATGVRVVRDDGGPLAFRQALVRALVGFFELWMTAGAIAMIASAINARGKRVGDMLAGTYAIKVRATKSQHRALVMPPALAEWSQSVDVRRLPDGLALSVRQFLTRASGLHPQSRQQLGTQLATELSSYVSPPPPAGTHPETMMTAVLVVRRDKEYALALQRQAADARQSDGIHRLPWGVPDSA